MDYEKRVYVITGTSSGIGKACATQLLDRGAAVIGIDMKESSIQHVEYSHYIADIRNEMRISEVFEDIDVRHKQVNGLCNCAGVFATSKPFFELNVSDWDKVIGINLTGVFVVSKYAAQRMISHREGKIVNISCIRSRIFRQNMADYAASKAGVTALTSSMALDLAPYNIRVNGVAPGFTYTSMTSKSFDNPEIRKASESLIPLGRIAEPEDIAKVVLFLLSDMSDYINGETIYADGGYKIFK